MTETESHWWIGVHIAAIAGIAAYIFHGLRYDYLTEMTEPARFSLEAVTVPAELMLSLEGLYILSLVTATVGMGLSLFLDARWTASQNTDWIPRPWLYGVAGVVPYIGFLVGIYYLWQRYRAVGIAGVNASNPPSEEEVVNGIWWRIVAVCTALSAVIFITLSVYGMIVGYGLVVGVPVFVSGVLLVTILMVTMAVAIVVDGKRIEAAGFSWSPPVVPYVLIAVVSVVISVLTLLLTVPMGIYYLYTRHKRVGLGM